METRDYHNPRLFHEEEYPVREPTYSSPPPSFFHYRIMQRGVGDFLDGIRYRLCETQRKLRADAFIPRLCLS